MYDSHPDRKMAGARRIGIVSSPTQVFNSRKARPRIRARNECHGNTYNVSYANEIHALDPRERVCSWPLALPVIEQINP